MQKKRVREGSAISPTLIFAALAVVALTVGLVTGRASNLVSLLASTTASLYTAPTTLFLAPLEEGMEFEVGSTVHLDVYIHSNTPINVVGATITFPNKKVEVLGISKEKSFLSLWTEDTTIREQEGEIRFSGGTTEKGGHIDTGTLLTLSLRIKEPGAIEIGFKDIEVYGTENLGTLLENEARTLSYVGVEKHIAATTGGAAITPDAAADDTPEEGPRPSADINRDGNVNLIDVSIFAFKMLGVYNPRIDLDRNGSLGISDLSILFSKMSRIR